MLHSKTFQLSSDLTCARWPEIEIIVMFDCPPRVDGTSWVSVYAMSHKMDLVIQSIHGKAETNTGCNDVNLDFKGTYTHQSADHWMFLCKFRAPEDRFFGLIVQLELNHLRFCPRDSSTDPRSLENALSKVSIMGEDKDNGGAMSAEQ